MRLIFGGLLLTKKKKNREIPVDLQDEVTEEEFSQARSFFLQFDLDSSGTISGNEFCMCLLQMDADGRKIDDLLAEADFMPGSCFHIAFSNRISQAKLDGLSFCDSWSGSIKAEPRMCIDRN